MPRLEVDVCVVGGGPAGSTFARRLSQFGFSVALLERDRFPRRHIGESLPPSILPILAAAGLREQVEAMHCLRPASAIVRWGSDDTVERAQGEEPGFQVDRGSFDALLLAEAAGCGVVVTQPCQVLQPTHDQLGRWSLDVLADDGPLTVKCRFLADASGKGNFLRGRRRRKSTRTLALYGYWKDVSIAGPQARVEAGTEQWYWAAPLPDGTLNAAVFVDSESLRAAGGDPDRCYRELLAQSHLVRPCLRGTLSAPVRACDATAYEAEKPMGDDWIRVGESCFSIDPLSSQGVQTAMVSSLLASVVVNTLLGDQPAGEMAQKFYRQRTTGEVQRQGLLAAGFYEQQRAFCPNAFWSERCQPPRAASNRPAHSPAPPPDTDTPLCWCEQMTLVDVPAIVGDRIVARPGIRHPNLAESVVFVGEMEVAPLVSLFQQATAATIKLAWQRQMSARSAEALLQWFWSRGILRPA